MSRRFIKRCGVLNAVAISMSVLLLQSPSFVDARDSHSEGAGRILSTKLFHSTNKPSSPIPTSLSPAATPTTSPNIGLYRIRPQFEPLESGRDTNDHSSPSDQFSNFSMFNLNTANYTDVEVCDFIINWVYQIRVEREAGQVYCNSTWDDVSCWPTTLAGSTAVIPCPDDLNGIDPSKNASRICNENGTWESKSQYAQCFEESGFELVSDQTVATRIIYYVGFSISTATLVVALFIFLYFRCLRCLRNVIHCQLMLTFVLRNIIWIVMDNALPPIIEADIMWLCKIIITIYNYLQGTNFSWMFVEGLYLHTVIVWTYSADKIRHAHYAIIGWGLPSIFSIAWCIVKAKMEDESCWLPITDSHYDYIYIVPILCVLVINIIFLISIISILVTKLRASHSLEARQYRKVVKATVILVPLLGLTYVLFIVPIGKGQVARAFFSYANAFFQSFQGFFVAIFYCFLNGEVKTCLKKRLHVWQDNRDFASRCTRASTVVMTGPSRGSNQTHIPLVNGNEPVYGNTSLKPGRRSTGESSGLGTDLEQDEHTV